LPHCSRALPFICFQLPSILSQFIGDFSPSLRIAARSQPSGEVLRDQFDTFG
jgi:hypothetical protein